MPNPTFAAFLQVPSFNRGYVNGHTKMVNTVLHFTVGRYGGDYAIGLKGYFNWYIPREFASVQFAEADALTWHAGSWNGDGCGIEFERLSYDEPLTDKQINDGGKLIGWLHDEWGIPLDFYDGPRVPAWAGFINHGSLLGRGETQDHTDGVLRSEWDAMQPEVAVPTTEDDDSMFLLKCKGKPDTIVVPEAYDAFEVTGAACANVVTVDDNQRQYIINAIRAGKK